MSDDLIAKVLEIQQYANRQGKVSMPKEFLHHFDTVCRYYQCTPAEIYDMKDAVRRDRDGAVECFKTLYLEVK